MCFMEYSFKETRELQGEGMLLDFDISKNCDGITVNSLSLLEEILKETGKDFFRIAYFDLVDGNENLILVDKNGHQIAFTGLTCGYGGEGPRGSIQALKLCGFDDGELDLVMTDEAIDLVYKK